MNEREMKKKKKINKIKLIKRKHICSNNIHPILYYVEWIYIGMTIGVEKATLC